MARRESPGDQVSKEGRETEAGSSCEGTDTPGSRDTDGEEEREGGE